MTSENRRLKKSRSQLLDGLGVPETKPFRADSFQLEAIESIVRGQDTLVVAPTGSGKTHIAIEGIKESLALGKRAVYTAPLKALSNTKYAEFKRLFEPQFSVGLLTGDRKIDGDANLVVATTEIYRNDLYSFRADYSLVVLDELHYLADSARGPVWEESIILSPEDATLLMLSASISNPFEIAEWIEFCRKKKVKVIVEQHRSVELRLGFMHPKYGVIPLEDKKGEVLPEITEYYSGSGGQSARITNNRRRKFPISRSRRGR